MKQWLQGPRPDVTPPQLVAMVGAGIPILASLLSAFGLYDLTTEQQDALGDAITWAGVVGAALIGGDAVIRTARNKRVGAVEAVLAEGGEQPDIVKDVKTDTSPPPSEMPTSMMDPPGGTTFEPPPSEPPIRRRGT